MYQITIVEAEEQDRDVLSRLMELYCYDFSEFTGWDVRDDGRFGDKGLDGCWTEPWRHPFLIRADGKLAGFGIVDERSHLTDDPQIRDMKEFFVMRKFRGQGVGAYVAAHLFVQFPGRWEVRQHRQNVAARSFWVRVIKRYTRGRFTEVTLDEKSGYQTMQSFTTASIA